MDTRSFLLDDEDPTEIDRIPAALLRLPAPDWKAEAKKPAVIPPPLPLALTRKVEPARLTDSDEVWLATLPLATRAVLEAARHATTEWPMAPRLAHAVVTPVMSAAYAAVRTPAVDLLLTEELEIADA